MYISQYIIVNFQKSFWVNNCMLFFVKYASINFRSPNNYTISIDLPSIRIGIRIGKQSKHKNAQARG